MQFNKQFTISAVVMFLVSLVAGFVVHAQLLANDYAALPGVMRPQAEQEQTFVWMLFAHALIGIGLTWLYRLGRENKPWLGQGIRFGLAFVVAAVVPSYLIYHAVAQFPLDLALRQCVYAGIAMLITGVVVAFMNR
ncbi:MAG: DUF1761 family protein [Gammaproteobacteria bacterium]|jgi:hypothetical protein|nr:DUF1761 family protein [Gammaproteobacteria bacterium]